MKKSTLLKDICFSFWKSKGRFVSIMCLMMLGSFALVGLKTASPDIEQTVSDYLSGLQVMDVAVISDYGLSQADQEELSDVAGTQVEYGYFTDTVLGDKTESIRVFSNPKTISKFQLVSGKLPKKKDEVALASFYQKRYQIGDKIDLNGENTQDMLERHQFTITGFVRSGELASTTTFGSSSSGSGRLSGYALVSSDVFQSSVYTVARFLYDDVKGKQSFSEAYTQKIKKHQEELETFLSDNGKKRLDSLRTDLQREIKQGEDALKKAQEELTSTQQQLENAQAQLNQERTRLKDIEATVSHSLNSEQLIQAKAAQEELNQAQAKLDEQKQEFAQKKAEAEAEIQKKRDQLQEAKEQQQQLTEPTYHVYTRRTFPGADEYQMTAMRASGISSVGNIFPIVLYLVAALVVVTTMTRFVNEERTNAGILRALGYEKKDVLKKFILYGLVSGGLGAVLGILAGTYFLPYILGKTLFVTSTYPALQLHFYWLPTLLAALCSMVCSTLPALYIAHKELKEVPSQLLLPKIPSKGSTIVLERLPFIWKRLSFTHKVTARNLFRYKQRGLMTIFGVAGSVALLFAGLGISSSLSGVGKRQFGDILRYDALVVQENHLSDKQEAALQRQLSSTDVTAFQKIYQGNFSKKIKGIEDEQAISLFVTKEKDFEPFVQLYQAHNQTPLSLQNQGAILSEKLADLLQVKIGDSVTVQSEQGKEYSIVVSEIAEMYAGHFIFMNEHYYQTVFATEMKENAYLLQFNDSSTAMVEKVAANFMKLEGVRAVIQNTGLIEQINTTVDSLGLVMQILTVVSVLLAIVILYNLTNINVAERIRELSTIKVLGFHQKEVTLYIYRETILLSIIGILLGLLAGRALHRYLLRMIAPDAILFNPTVSLSVYLVPVLSIIVILIGLGYFVHQTLRRVDMLEALKSVE